MTQARRAIVVGALVAIPIALGLFRIQRSAPT